MVSPTCFECRRSSVAGSTRRNESCRDPEFMPPIHHCGMCRLRSGQVELVADEVTGDEETDDGEHQVLDAAVDAEDQSYVVDHRRADGGQVH